MKSDQLGISIRWHLNAGYRIERTVEIFKNRGATLDLVTEISEKMKRERVILRGLGQ